jgi:hypothetical protein
MSMALSTNFSRKSAPDLAAPSCKSARGVLYYAPERCQSGRMCRSRKAVGPEKPSWVRIPLSPPLDGARLAAAYPVPFVFLTPFQALPGTYRRQRARAGVSFTEESHSGLVSTTGNRVGLTAPVGSNPTSSATMPTAEQQAISSEGMKDGSSRSFIPSAFVRFTVAAAASPSTSCNLPDDAG